jgi:hypothetical protein
MLKKVTLFGLALIMAVAMACGGDSKAPVSPTPAVGADAEAAADGSTLKVSAPTVYVPASGAVLDTLTPNLAVNPASGKFVSATGLTYRFSVETAAGTQVYQSGQVSPQPGVTFAAQRIPDNTLTNEVTYRWRARAESGSLYGPWSAYWTFTTPPKKLDPTSTPSFIRATELWDNLTDGKSIGSAVNMEFTVGKGARTVSNDSYIQYALLQTLSAGEMSFYVDNLNPLSAGDKTKLMSMAQGNDDITTNPYRFTIEKRGATYPSPGQVRWRMITGDSGDHTKINDGGPWQPTLDKTKTYFVKATWGNGLITLKIQEYNTATQQLGSVALSVSQGYNGTYRPNPQMAYVGAPPGRAGSQDASVANMTVRYVYISAPGGVRPGAILGMNDEQ